MLKITSQEELKYSDTLKFQQTSCEQKTSKDDNDKASEQNFGVICQTGIFHPATETKLDEPSEANDANCLSSIPLEKSVVEYRFHLEQNLDTKEVACEMGTHNGLHGSHVDYRRGKFFIAVLINGMEYAT